MSINFIKKLSLTNFFEYNKNNLILFIPVIFGCSIIFYFSFCNDSNLISAIFASFILFFTIIVNFRHKNEQKSLILPIIIIFLSGFLYAKFYDKQFIKAPKINTKIYGDVIGEISEIKEYKGAKKRIILSDLNIYKSRFIKKTTRKNRKSKSSILSKKPIKITKKIKNKYLNLEGYNELDRKLEKIKKNINYNIFVNNKHPNPPKKISIYIRNSNQNLEIGDIIKIKTLLEPIAKKDLLDNFNFPRYYYFKQIGAQGFAIGKPKIIGKNLKINFTHKIDNWRYNLAKKINKDFKNQEASAIFNALLLGIRDYINPDLMNNIRKAGLAHLIAISGLHLSLAAFIFFNFFRYLLSRSEYLALKFDLKKVSAILAIFSSLAYLFIAGVPISALRAFFMILLVFLAILLDEKPNPFRSLMFGALVILLMNPASIYSISFQMSFGALIALISFYEFSKKSEYNYKETIFHKFIYYFLAIISSSLICQIALAPLTIYYFNQVNIFGILANLIAIPLTSLIIMPLAFCYLFLLIFKLEFLTIYPLNFAIERIINVANYFANFELSNIKISLISTNSLILIIFGFLWISLWQKNWRLLGFIPIIFGCFLAYKITLPNLIIDGKSQFFAIYNKNEDLFFSPKTRKSLRVNSLIEKFASSKFQTIDEMKDERIFCKYEYCYANIRNNKILILRKRSKITNICQKNYDILVNLSKFKLPDCVLNNRNLKVINNHDLALEGNNYLFFD